MAEPQESLERVVVSLESAGEFKAAEKVKALLAKFDKPEPKEEEPEPAKRGPGRPRKEA